MRWLGGGGFRHYLGNGSVADIASLTESKQCRQICLALRRAMARSAWRGNTLGDRAEVSIGHITEIENRGAVIRPFKLGNPPARSYGKDRTNIGEPTCIPSRLPARQRIPKRSLTAEPDVGGINSNHRRVL